MSGADPATAIARVDLRVTDRERALRWYAEVAGLERVGDDAVGSGGRALVRVTDEGVAPGGVAPRRASGLFHTALRFGSRADLGEALRRLVHARAPLSGASDHGVSEALYLDDPDGNGVELYWDRPREDWPAAEPGERVRMFTAPLDLESLLAAAPPEERPVDVGHVHLKVSAIDPAVAFWTDGVGLDLMTRYGADAVFLAAGGYHHHVGANTWMSAGAGPGPRELPGLEAVTLSVPDRAALDAAATRLSAPVEDGAVAVTDPDGTRVVISVAPTQGV